MFSGSLVAIVTPMRPDGAVDHSAWARLLDFHLQSGTSGIVVAGTTGEAAALSDSELRELAETASRQLRGRVPLIVGASTSNTATTIQRMRVLDGLAIDGVLVATPAYVKPTQEGLYQHYAAIAEAARVSVILYNVPGRTAVDMLPATVARLAKLPRITGLKEAVSDIGRVRELVALCGSHFTVLSGDDPTAREAVVAGARGVISVTANVAPREVTEVMAAAIQGDHAKAAHLDGRLAALHRALFLEPNPIPAKWALAEVGLIGRGIRLPLTQFASEHHAELRRVLHEAGVMK